MITRSFSTAQATTSGTQLIKSHSKILQYNFNSKEYVLQDIKDIENYISQKSLYLIRDFPIQALKTDQQGQQEQADQKTKSKDPAGTNASEDSGLLETIFEYQAQEYGTKTYNKLLMLKNESKVDEIIGLVPMKHPQTANITSEEILKAKRYMEKFETRDMLKVLFMNQDQIDRILNGEANSECVLRSSQDKNLGNIYKSNPKLYRLYLRYLLNMGLFIGTSAANIWFFNQLLGFNRIAQEQ
eukprot:403374330